MEAHEVVASLGVQPVHGIGKERDDHAMSEAELLTSEELEMLTGRKTSAGQRRWLECEGWVFVRNASGRPIVGRWYARLKLAGVKPEPVAANEPDFSAIT